MAMLFEGYWASGVACEDVYVYICGVGMVPPAWCCSWLRVDMAETPAGLAEKNRFMRTKQPVVAVE